MARILLAHDKEITKTSGPNGVLSRLFRKMLLDLGIMPPKFGSFLQDYIIDTQRNIPNNKRDQTSMRGNLTKEFAKPQMTWKVFCKALRFLQIIKIDLVIKAYHGNGMTTLHSTEVQFGNRESFAEFIENLEQPEKDEAVPYVQILADKTTED